MVIDLRALSTKQIEFGVLPSIGSMQMKQTS